MHIDQMLRVVFRYRPGLKNIYENYGKQSVAEYARSVYAQKKPTDNVVTEAIAKIAGKTLGQDVAGRVRESLEKSNYVSTVDHHGPLSHPSFFQPNILRALLDKEEGIPATVVLSCASVSLDNHSFPRGMYVHDPSGEERRLSIFNTRHRRSCVYAQPSFSQAEADIFLKQAKVYPEISEKLADIFSEEKLFTLGNYRSQVTLINYRLIKALGLGGSDFVSVSIEEVAREVLLSHHFKNTTPIHQIIFHAESRHAFLRETAGIPTSHDFANSTTAVLFWGIHEGIRLPLRIEHGMLVDTGKNIQIRLQESDMAQALLAEKIFPNLALCLILLSYHGLRLGGGFSQVDYLPELIKKSRKVFRKITPEKRVWEKGNFMGGDFLFLPRGLSYETTSLDVFRQPLSGSAVHTSAQATLLSEAIERVIPDAYAIITASQKKKKTCFFCGNNQTSHFLSFITTATSLVIIDPLAYALFPTWVGRFLFRLARWVLLFFYRLFTWCQVLKLDSRPARVPNSTAKVLFDEAARRGWKMETLMAYGKAIDVYRVTLPGQTPFFFDGLPRPQIDESSAMGWMDDKAILKHRLRRAGIPVPQGESFSSYRKAKRYFEQSRVPMIVKPRLGSRGRHTTTHITQAEHFRKAFRIARQLCPFVIVEEHLEGSVYRATLIDGKLAGVLAGDPPRITGDNKKTIRELINQKNKNRPRRVSEVIVTNILISFLERRGYTLDDVLEENVTLDLSEKIGIRYGGKSREVTPAVHPKLHALLEQAASVVHDPLIGFDFITPDVSVDPETVRWGIIECNAMPFIDLHHDPLEGEPVNVAAKLWDYIERKTTKFDHGKIPKNEC